MISLNCCWFPGPWPSLLGLIVHGVGGLVAASQLGRHLPLLLLGLFLLFFLEIGLTLAACLPGGSTPPHGTHHRTHGARSAPGSTSPPPSRLVLRGFLLLRVRFPVAVLVKVIDQGASASGISVELGGGDEHDLVANQASARLGGHPFAIGFVIIGNQHSLGGILSILGEVRGLDASALEHFDDVVSLLVAIDVGLGRLGRILDLIGVRSMDFLDRAAPRQTMNSSDVRATVALSPYRKPTSLSFSTVGWAIRASPVYSGISRNPRGKRLMILGISRSSDV